jgi:hypothetical protein
LTLRELAILQYCPVGYNNKREIHFYWYGSPVAYGYLEAEFKADLGVNDGYKLPSIGLKRRLEGTWALVTVLMLSSQTEADLVSCPS